MKHVIALVALALLAGCATAPKLSSYGPQPTVTKQQVSDHLGVEVGKAGKPKRGYQWGTFQPVSWQGYIQPVQLAGEGDDGPVFYILERGNVINDVVKASDHNATRLKYSNGEQVIHKDDDGIQFTSCDGWGTCMTY